MVKSSSDGGSDGEGLDAIATALAHPGRRRIITRLGLGPATSSELAAEIGVGLPALHKHLVVLSTAAVIRSHKTGRVVRHRLSPRPLQDFDAWLVARSAFWNHQLSALESAVTTTPDPAQERPHPEER